MKVKVNKNRQVFKGSLSVGISNENNYEVLEFTFPQELDNYIKYIEIQAENEEGKLEYVDRIQDNKFTLTNRLTKYRELNMEISCRDLNRTVFKSEIFTVTTGEALNILEDLVEQQEDLFERVERELQEVYQGMEEFKTEIVEDANSRFNTNVTERTQGFNTNAETKTNNFNSNYDEKLGTFNTNATSKLEQYNNNDTTKTQAYNTNATEKLNTYNTNATSKLAEYNSNAETKLNTYNTNATQKLAEYDDRVAELHEDLDETQDKVDQYNTNIDTKYTQYNNNAEQKLSAYNQNATQKTNAYNTNAQTKLDTFNTNATNKTTTYNTNATEKLTAYNTNATEKIDEYNENASELMNSVDELEQKHDNEVAELNEKIADLQEQVDMAGDLIPTGEETGDNITLNNSAWYRFKKVLAGGKSEQDGAPTPESEVSIQNVTGNVEVKVENKNIFTGLIKGTGINSSTGEPTTGSKSSSTDFIEIDMQNNYYLSGLTDKLFSFVYFYDENKTGIKRTSAAATTSVLISSATITGIENAKYIKVTQYENPTTSGTIDDVDNLKIQLEIGSTATDYIAHEEQTATFPLEEGQVLHASDTIEDKIVQRRKTLLLNGTENFTAVSVGTNSYALNNVISANYDENKLQMICNYFKGIPAIDRNTGNNIIYVSTNNQFIIRNTSFNSVTELKSWLAEKYANGTPVTIEYELATPIETEFTETQRTAKKEIDKLYSYKGTTHITSNANLDVTYRKDPNLAEEQQNSKLEELEARLVLLEG